MVLAKRRRPTTLYPRAESGLRPGPAPRARAGGDRKKPGRSIVTARASFFLAAAIFAKGERMGARLRYSRPNCTEPLPTARHPGLTPRNGLELAAMKEGALRGRRPTPTHLKLLRGNPGQRAIRPTVEPPRPTEPPAAPDILTGYARQEWDEVAPKLWRLGCLSAIDVAALAAYCEAYKRWRTAVTTLDEMAERDPVMRGQIVKTQSGGAAPNPIVLIADKAARDMVRFASEFGMTASARARISAGPRIGPNKWAGMIGGVDLA